MATDAAAGAAGETDMASPRLDCKEKLLATLLSNNLLSFSYFFGVESQTLHSKKDVCGVLGGEEPLHILIFHSCYIVLLFFITPTL